MITIVRRSKKRVSVFQWILATALFTVSCTTDVWNETEDDANAICFQAPQTESRAAVEGSSLPANSSFLVWGGYDNNVTNVFDGETVSEFGGVWNYEGGTRYWIPGKTYSFYGVYPYGLENVSCTNEGTLNISNFDCSTSTDLMVASRPNIVAEDGISQGVQLSFRHLLARVVLVAQCNEGASGITDFSPVIYSVVLHGMYKTGDYKFENSDSWVIPSSGTGESPTSKDDPFFKWIGKKEVTDGGAKVMDVLVFPQLIGMDYYMDVIYSITDNVNAEKKSVSIPLSSLSVYEWAAGKQYRYSLIITPDDRIIFNKPTVNKWDEAVGGIIIID